MKRKFIKINLLISLCLISTIGLAQAPYWTKPTTQENANYYLMADSADAYYASQPIDSSEGGEFAMFNRWKNFWQYRVDTSGSFAPYLLEGIDIFTNNNFCNGSGVYNEKWENIGHKNSDLGNVGTEGQGWATKIFPAPNSTNLYLGSKKGGLWRTKSWSTANRPIWTNITDNIRGPVFGIKDIAVDPLDTNRIYILSASERPKSIGVGLGLLATTDYGANWGVTGLSMFDAQGKFTDFQSVIYISPVSDYSTYSNIIFVARGNELLKTTNAGNSFNTVNVDANGESNFSGDIRQIRYIASSPSTFFVSTFDGELWRTTDNGVNWTLITPSNSNISKPATTPFLMDISAQSGTLVLIYKNSFNRIVTENSSASILAFNSLTSTYAVVQTLKDFAVSGLDDDILYFIYRSNSFPELTHSINGGVTFTRPNRLDWHGDANDLHLVSDIVNNEDLIYVANDGGLNLAQMTYLLTPNITLTGNVSHNLNGDSLTITEIYSFDIDQEDNWIAIGCQDLGDYHRYNTEWRTKTFSDGFSIAYNGVVTPDEMIVELNRRQFVTYERPTTGIPTTKTNLVTLWNINNGTEELVVDTRGNIFIGRYSGLFRKNNNETTFSTTALNDFNEAGSNIKGIGFSKTNPDILYVGLDKPTWDGNSKANRLFKCENLTSASPSWVDIGAQTILPLNWQGISEIVVDPNGEDSLWVCVGQNFVNYAPGQVTRIYYSKDGGDTWVSINEGLEVATGSPLKFTINDMELDESTGGMYLATDIGVYYNPSPKDPTSEWVCYNQDMPITVVVQLRIDYCRRKLMAATHGRGLFESDLASSEIVTTTINILNNVVPSSTNQFSYTNIIVPAGIVFTVNGNLKMAPDRKIVVEKGGELNVDGGSITCICNNHWKGIYVEGNSSLPQIPNSNQGLLVLDNATLEHASTAVNLFGLNSSGNIDYVSSGGIVKSKESTFKDNWRDVSFIGYTNQVYPTGAGSKNMSYFYDTEFITTDEYVKDHVTDIWPNVTMWGVEWIDFRSCTFDDQRDGNVIPSMLDRKNRRDGIYSLDASYRINQNYVSSPLTYPGGGAGPRPVFKGMRYGIQSIDNPASQHGALQSMPSSIVNADFECLGGILHSGVQHAIINNCRLDIAGYPPQPSQTIREVDAYGIYTDNCTGYQIEGDTLDSDWTANTGANLAVGILTKENRERNNRVYRNFFDDYLIGAEALGWNKDENAVLMDKGLKYRCNDFAGKQDNYMDMWVIDDKQSLHHTTPQIGIPHQGSLTNPAANLFGAYIGPGINTHITNQFITSLFDYYHHDVTSNSRVVPNIKANVNNIATTLAYNLLLNCPDETSSGVGVNNSEVIAINDLLFMKKKKFKIASDETDGGNTSGLHSDVINADVATIGPLLIDLTAKSPYLSNIVLEQIAVSYSPFTKKNVRDIMLLNPHSSRNPTLMGSLTNRTDTFPSLYIDQIDSLLETYTERDTLYDEAYYYSNEYEHQLNSVLRRALNDTIDKFTDIIEPVLDAANEVQYAYKLINMYDQRGETTKALNKLNTLPDSFNLSTTQLEYLTDYTLLRNLLKSWANSNKNLAELDSIDILALEYYQTRGNGIANSVLPLLLLNQSTSYTPPIYNPLLVPVSTYDENLDENWTDVMNNPPIDRIGLQKDNSDLEISNGVMVYPNPSNGKITVAYDQLPEFSYGVITIVGTKGDVIRKKTIDNKFGKTDFDLSNQPSGVYVCNFKLDDKLVKQVKFILEK